MRCGGEAAGHGDLCHGLIRLLDQHQGLLQSRVGDETLERPNGDRFFSLVVEATIIYITRIVKTVRVFV